MLMDRPIPSKGREWRTFRWNIKASAHVVVCILALTMQMQAQGTPLLPDDMACDGELQQIMCGLIPFSAAPERHACCAMYQHSRHTHVAALGEWSDPEEHKTVDTPVPLQARPDLAAIASSTTSLAERYAAGSCTNVVQAFVPAFDGNQSTTTEELNTMYQLVPQLSGDMIKQIKVDALAQIQAANDTSNTIWSNYMAYSTVNAESGFTHPGTYAGAAELAVMQYRLSNGLQPQSTALQSLLSGAGIPAKIMDPVTLWAPPTDCTPDSYPGPYPMSVALIRYGGVNDRALGPCAANYPPDAPQHICGHVSFVELDGQMVYKQALALWATGDTRHGLTALHILDGWAATNVKFGPALDGNGALEAAWGCASLSRAMELLKSHPSFWAVHGSDASFQQFVGWLSSTLMPVMEAWVDFKRPPVHWEDDGNVLANWHASISECWMAFGILTDDRGRYNKAVELFRATVQGYLKWGRGKYAANRLIGETTETLRDIYHTLFGLGGLLQAAEMAFGQDDDLYSSSGHVLAAAMEVHAKIVNAGTNESLLPPNFRFYESMPPPPKGCVWRINMRSQLWSAINKTTGAWVTDLMDGLKYVLGSKYLPTGFEVGYNHFAGRLGMQMPETAALLARYWPEWYEFHWGLGTLSHAGTAALLWQPGVREATLCHDSSLPAQGDDARENQNEIENDAGGGDDGSTLPPASSADAGSAGNGRSDDGAAVGSGSSSGNSDAGSQPWPPSNSDVGSGTGEQDGAGGRVDNSRDGGISLTLPVGPQGAPSGIITGR